MVIVNTKNPIRAPESIAPRKLVAAKVIPRSTNAKIKVPTIPEVTNPSARHAQDAFVLLPETRSNTARYTTLIPKATHKNAGVRVITALIVKIAAKTPQIMLIAMLRPIQVVLQPQFEPVIFFTSPSYLNAENIAFVIIYACCEIMVILRYYLFMNKKKS